MLFDLDDFTSEPVSVSYPPILSLRKLTKDRWGFLGLYVVFLLSSQFSADLYIHIY